MKETDNVLLTAKGEKMSYWLKMEDQQATEPSIDLFRDPEHLCHLLHDRMCNAQNRAFPRFGSFFSGLYQSPWRKSYHDPSLIEYDPMPWRLLPFAPGTSFKMPFCFSLLWT